MEEKLKIKQDFVTNSSSINYIVALPEDFVVEDFLSIREHMDMFDNPRVQKDNVIEAFLALMMDGNLQSYEFEDNPYTFNHVLRILNDLGAVVRTIDTPAGAPYVIHNIGPDVKKAQEKVNELKRRKHAVRPLEEGSRKAL